jgi:hypothetical protein
MDAAAGRRPVRGGNDTRVEEIVNWVGGGTFGYYRFLKEFGREPMDAVDFFDGLATANALGEIEGLKWHA